MSAEDYMPDDLGTNDEDSYGFVDWWRPRGRRIDPRCFRCGARCTWSHTTGVWRLMQGGAFHACPTIDDFQALRS